MTIGEAQNRVDEWIVRFGVRYFNELTNMAVLVIIMAVAFSITALVISLFRNQDQPPTAEGMYILTTLHLPRDNPLTRSC